MGVLLTADSFNRASNASSLGSTDGAGNLDPIAWVPQVGTWGIQSNAYAYSPSGTIPSIVTVDTGHSNVDARASLVSSGGFSGDYLGLVFRYSDSNNYMRVHRTQSTDALELVKRVAGVDTVLWSIGTPGWNTGGNAEVRVTAINNVLTVYLNGTVRFVMIESHNRSATKCGLTINNHAYQLDDFAVYTIDNVPVELSTDSFDRINNTVLGNTDGAGTLDPLTWDAQGGSAYISDIVSNQATVGGSSTQAIHPTGFTVVGNINYLEAGTPDVQLYVVLSAISSASAGLIFRYVDANNYWLYFANQATSTILYKRLAGVWYNMSGTLAGTTAVGVPISVKLAGSTIICVVNGVVRFTTSDTDLQTATKHGFMSGSNGGSAFGFLDRFQMWEGDPAIPVIAQVGPTQGPVQGGTNVTIVGNNFAAATGVAFGSVPASAFTVISDKYIEATSPAHSSGLTDINVTNPDGTNVIGVTDQFSYIVPPPLVSSVTPNHGLPAGGYSVVITGAYFTGATSVKFGTTEATSFTVNNDGQITATAPAHASGVTPIIVTTPWGSNG